VSENWRRIAEFRRPISSLRLTVSADAEIEIRHNGLATHNISVPANNFIELDARTYPRLPTSFSVFLRSDDPSCQCQIQAEYTEAVTDVLHDAAFPRNIPIVDMRLLYGPMGLGFPFALSVSGNLLDYTVVPANQPPSIVDALRRDARAIEEAQRPKEQLKEEKPCPGITRLQAFKRELEEEEKPKEKEKHKFLSKLKRKRGENKK